MMTHEEWREFIIQQLRALADADEQRQTWFGMSNRVSSPVEDVCGLVDDALLPEFLVEQRARISESQFQALSAVLKATDALGDMIGDGGSPDALIDDPRWECVRRAAQNALHALRE